jgi:hypothetical protein
VYHEDADHRAEQPENRAGIVAAVPTTAQSAEEYRAHAADCQEVADRWSGLLKDQYEELARQWLELAERTR